MYFLQCQVQCIALNKYLLNEITYSVLFFWSYMLKVLFIGMNFSLLLMEINNLQLRLKPKKWNMILPSDLLVSSTTQAQLKSSVIAAIPSMLTLMTQRTNQVGFSFFFLGWGEELGWLDGTFLSFIFELPMHCVFLISTLLELRVKVLFD